MNELKIVVDSKPPIISGNFEMLQNLLKTELDKYDVIIDIDSEKDVKEARAIATNINKLKGQIDTLRKDEVAKLSAPITEFTAKMNELKILCEDSRQKILGQIRVVDDNKRTKLKTLLDKELEATYLKYGINIEFKIVKIDDLVIVSNLNKSGIAKSARDAIDERVLETKRFQEKIDKRLLTLETICYQGGLPVPLTRENIEYFLKESDDDIYLNKLVSLIKNEITRLEKAEKIKREQEITKAKIIAVDIKENKQENPLNTTASHIETKEPQVPSQYAHFKNVNEFKKPLVKNSKKTYVVTATFEISIKEELSPGLEKALVKKFKNAGFKTIPTVDVKEVFKTA